MSQVWSSRLCDKIFHLRVELSLFSHFFLIPSKGYEDLRQTVESLQSALNVSKVIQSLESVRILASRPAALLDPFALLSALEQLSDHARDANHPQRKV